MNEIDEIYQQVMDKNITFNRTRIAPTPSGFLHLGNIYSFALTAALAKKTNAKILLRIDDADMERTNKRYVQDIFDTLNFLEIPWHEGPRDVHEYETQYSQRHRMDMYREALQQMRESSSVLFACTCTRTDVLRLNADSTYAGTCIGKNLPLDTPNTSWRLKTNETNELVIKTFGGAIVNEPLSANMQCFIVRKKDGLPAYQLTSLVDDCYFGVDLIIRGADLWASTLAQLSLAPLCGRSGFADTTFYHHPLLTDEAGNKLSKSEGATSVYYLREYGKKSEEIYALIARVMNMEGEPKSWEELVAMAGI